MSSESTSAKKRQVTTVIGAPSSIGIRPYDHTSEPREVARAPHIFRELGLMARLGATDLGDVTPHTWLSTWLLSISSFNGTA